MRATGPHCSDLTIYPDAMGEGGARGGSGVSILRKPVGNRHRSACRQKDQINYSSRTDVMFDQVHFNSRPAFGTQVGLLSL